MSDAVAGALIGLAGLLLGLLGGEYFRRRSRIEGYSKEVFLKRLEVYETLYGKLNVAATLASAFERAENDNLEDLVSLTHALVLGTAQFTDDMGLYINDEVFMQCMLTLLILPSDGTPKELEEFKRNQVKRFRENHYTSRLMIKEETGLAELDKLFHGLTKAKHDSDFVNYYRERKKQHGIK